MKAVALVVRKDLLVLRRAPVLLGTLVAYPLVVALLVGLVAGYASSKPRVALVDEAGLPHTITLAGQRFDVDATIRRASRSVKLVRLSRSEAARELRTARSSRRSPSHRPSSRTCAACSRAPHLTCGQAVGRSALA